MNDTQRYVLLEEAIKELKLTKEGYPENIISGTHWARAMPKLNKLAADLKPSKIVVPVLGPVWKNSKAKSILLHDLTHASSGLPKDLKGVSLWPAFDDAFNVGEVIIACEDMVVYRESSSNPGEAFYAKGKSKIRYWYAHLDRTHREGTIFKKGDAVGKVYPNSIGGGPHAHVAVNIEHLIGIGEQLKHNTNYTHGAPLIGVQLKQLLAA